MYQIVRKLELRTAADSVRIEQINEIFSGKFDKLVVKTNRDFIDFATLVDKLEDIRDAAGGNVRDETANERVTYEAPMAPGSFSRSRPEEFRFPQEAPGRCVCC
ncbi:MAG: hypothetical protein CPDRYMAC_5887 [uncultured Paraburkholderia sp.]|nr:MAG: hypothetical protein CPDRYDRY_5826 [uncultured Paraburkholderia sp.]CAH2942803.1 MAG: hypothetical protein CPDRYMAC_5887 [uncultured Paraburkholderia sp.]